MPATSSAPVLSLADLQAFDGGAREPKGDEQRFLCPLPGLCEGKPRDNNHRNFCVNLHTGRWECKVCGQSGCLKDFWEGSKREQPGAFGRPKPSGRAFSASPLRTEARAADPAPKPEAAAKVRQALAAGSGPLPLADSPGADFLNGRLLSVELAAEAGVEFHPAWMGGPAVLYPLRNAAGEVVAVEGRYTDGRTEPKTRCVGSKSLGFFATPGAWEASVVALAEGPADILALATMGLPGVCVFGSALKLPAGLARKLFRKRVLIASDADEKGDSCAPHWAAELESVAAKPVRFRPPVGKDWGDVLERDPELMAAAISEWVTPDHAPVRSVPPPARPTPPPAPVEEKREPAKIFQPPASHQQLQEREPAGMQPGAMQAPTENGKSSVFGNPPESRQRFEERSFAEIEAPIPFVDEWDAAPLPEPPPEAPADPAPQAARPDPYRLPARSEWPEDGPADSREDLAVAKLCREWQAPFRPLWNDNEEETTPAAPVGINRPESAPLAAPVSPTYPDGLPGKEPALALPVATAAAIQGEGAGLGWEYLSAWVSATYLDSGPGTTRFLSLLTDDERSELRGAWEQAFAEWKAYITAPEGDPEGLAHAEVALALWDQLAEHVGVLPEEFGWLVRQAANHYAEKFNARLFPEEIPAEPAAKGKQRKLLTWDRETQARIQWLETWEPLKDAFALYPYRIILDPAAFKAQLMGEVAAGVNGARARYGALQSDLNRLHWCFACEAGSPRIDSNSETRELETNTSSKKEILLQSVAEVGKMK